MKVALIAATLALAALSVPAAAQQYRNDPNWRQAEECWNTQAGRFERVRPGETQNDLDYSRCRPTGTLRDDARECWNSRARSFEAVRPGERQDDLDMNRCHPIAERGYARGRDEPRECWNSRARRFETVRPGERQDDLDMSRCRRR